MRPECDENENESSRWETENETNSYENENETQTSKILIFNMRRHKLIFILKPNFTFCY